MTRMLLFSMALMAAMLSTALGNIIYVDINAAGKSDGSSWADAYNYLQDALAAASSGDEIRVAEGIYRPDQDANHSSGSGDRKATFQLKNEVALYGGFRSGGCAWKDRDTNTYETILSGNLNGDNGRDFPHNRENSCHVVTGSGTEPSAVLDGFTITAGHGVHGAGMLNKNGSPVLANCTFRDNWAYECGGGILSSGNSNYLTLVNCTFIGNSAGQGGGMDINGSAALTSCTFIGNSASHCGGGIHSRANAAFSNCVFAINSAEHGGGVCNRADGREVVLNFCVFSGNLAEDGGGVANYFSRPVFTNCTLSANSAEGKGGGMYNGRYARPTLANCILWGNWGNREAEEQDETAQIHNEGNRTTVKYCCIQGWTGSLGGIGNIKDDPLFVDAANGDYHLLPGSPCIDAASDADVPNDLDGIARTHQGSHYDIGSYEWPPNGLNRGPVPTKVPDSIVFRYWGNRHPDLTPPALETAIARADNDYVFNGPYEDKDSKRVKLPGVVRKKICEAVLRKFNSMYHETLTKYSDLFGPVFQIQVPDREHLRLYIYKLKGIGTFHDVICLILHDNHSRKVSPVPRCFSGQWMSGSLMAAPMKPPFVDFDDLNLDGNPEVVFKERIHNGTSLNAIVHHFLHIGGDLSLLPIFRLEARSYGYDGRSGYLIRTIEKPEPNQVLVRVSVSSDPFKEGKKNIGYAIFESPDASSPLTVKEKVMHLEKEDFGRWTLNYEKLLLNTWGSPYR